MAKRTKGLEQNESCKRSLIFSKDQRTRSIDLDHHPLKDRFKFIDLDQRSVHFKRSLNINRLLCWPK